MRLRLNKKVCIIHLLNSWTNKLKQMNEQTTKAQMNEWRQTKWLTVHVQISKYNCLETENKRSTKMPVVCILCTVKLIQRWDFKVYN